MLFSVSKVFVYRFPRDFFTCQHPVEKGIEDEFVRQPTS